MNSRLKDFPRQFYRLSLFCAFETLDLKTHKIPALLASLFPGIFEAKKPYISIYPIKFALRLFNRVNITPKLPIEIQQSGWL